ncbi:tubulin-specific chaperone cofactor E-like protein isoform X2 [Planococcus citri]
MPSLLEAINEKYGIYGDEIFDQTPVAIYVPKRSPRKYIPSLLVLNDCDIDSAGHEIDLKEKCKTVEDLDLAQNNLSQWNEILTILRIMPKLKFANLSFNDLSEDVLRCEEQQAEHFPSLKSIVLNATHITWTNVTRILKLLPNIEELHLSLNEYNDIDLKDDDGNLICLPSVKRLHFTGNHVSSWSVIRKLGQAFPKLEILVLADCPLTSLSTGQPSSEQYGRSESQSESSEIESDSAHSSFRYLKFLNLNNTLLSTWDDIDRLSGFPSLQCLRVLGCPLFGEYTKHERRQLLIARLPNIRVLNGGGEITSEEREDAERAFIRYYMDKPESDRPERYTELVSIHGKLDPLVNVDLSPERKVKVAIIYGTLVEERSIDVYQTVNELKQKLENFADMSASKMKLFYSNQHMKQVIGPEHMKFPNKQLYSYNIRNGDEIIVESKLNK